MFGLSHMLLDATGNASVLEATRGRYALRHAGDNNESGYLVAANHYKNAAMKPSQPVWDPLAYYPSSYYRYLTAEKMIADAAGQFNYSGAVETLSLTDWWYGGAWHRGEPWSTNTINRFRPDVATLYSAIAMPRESRLSICTGNPGMPYWGTLAPGQTGIYVNYTLGQGPEALVFALQEDASSALWQTVQALGVAEGAAPDEATALWKEAEGSYWEAFWWTDRAVLEEDPSARAAAWGRSATGYAEVIVKTAEVREACKRARPTN